MHADLQVPASCTLESYPKVSSEKNINKQHFFAKIHRGKNSGGSWEFKDRV